MPPFLFYVSLLLKSVSLLSFLRFAFHSLLVCLSNYSTYVLITSPIPHPHIQLGLVYTMVFNLSMYVYVYVRSKLSNMFFMVTG